jgi:uncharacterized protein YbjT (DUF2867 family)
MNAWITGATGLVGRALLEALLAEPRVETVLAVVRRPLERAHPKLEGDARLLLSRHDHQESRQPAGVLSRGP